MSVGVSAAADASDATIGVSASQWESARYAESNFWRQTLNLSMAEMQLRMVPTLQFVFQGDLFSTAQPRQTHFRALDVGSGPLTSVGFQLYDGHDGESTKRLELFAADPLATLYDPILDEFGLQPVVRARQIKAEQLTRHFAHDWFDIAVSTNAIDHTMNPLVAIEQMVAVVKPGHLIVLEVRENEGRREKWDKHHGAFFHNWNFAAGSSGTGTLTIQGRPSRSTHPPRWTVANELCETVESAICTRRARSYLGKVYPEDVISCVLRKRVDVVQCPNNSSVWRSTISKKY